MKLNYGLFTTVLTTLLFCTNGASAGLLIDPYVGATIGAGGQTLYADGDYDSDSAQSYGAVLGMDIPLVRIELEYDFLNRKDSDVHLGMINAYLKMPTPVIHPYIGAGIGSTFDGEIYGREIDASVAYQGMLGLTFDIPVVPINIDAEMRVLYSANVYENVSNSPDLLQYDLRLKLRFVF